MCVCVCVGGGGAETRAIKLHFLQPQLSYLLNCQVSVPGIITGCLLTCACSRGLSKHVNCLNMAV